jgi:ribosomal protein S18 acetylase RimI-like enzyme
MTPSIHPIPLEKTRIADAADMLWCAFADDPFVQRLYPDAVSRRRHFVRTTKMMLHYGLSCGEVFATSSNLEGVAIWYPSDRITPSLWSMVRFGFFLLPFSIGFRSFRVALAYMDHSAQMRERHVHGPHWYLQLLGVNPSYQGGGYGSLLLRSTLARLDSERVPCCLDTENEKNVAMYEHFGFRVRESSEISGCHGQMWLMVREVDAMPRA